TFTTVGSPLKLSDSPVHITTSPLLGQHNEEILHGELGISPDELPLLKAQGVI
ncbi:formyl-CoA transferase, partial [Streptomyces sp. NPDC006602]